MFEKTQFPGIPCAGDVPDRSAHDSVSTKNGSGEDAILLESVPLHSIEWNELAARLTAARDLRQLLRKDIAAQVNAEDLAFADAATQFFKTNEGDELCVNSTVLDGRKSSSGMYTQVQRKGSSELPFADHDNVIHEDQEQPQIGDVSRA